MLSNKTLEQIVTELFIRGRNLNIFLIFITQSYLTAPRNIKLDSIHYFIMKIANKRELQQITFNHSRDINFVDFIHLYKKCTAKIFSILVNDTTFAPDNSLSFRCSLFRKNIKN